MDEAVDDGAVDDSATDEGASDEGVAEPFVGGVELPPPPPPQPVAMNKPDNNPDNKSVFIIFMMIPDAIVNKNCACSGGKCANGIQEGLTLELKTVAIGKKC